MSYKEKNSGGDALVAGILFGIVSGALFTLLCTPKTGKEFRDDLKSKANELPIEVNNLLADIKDFYAKSVDLLSSISKEQYSKIKDVVGETQKTVKEKINAVSNNNGQG
jgi:gas vesicle protein